MIERHLLLSGIVANLDTLVVGMSQAVAGAGIHQATAGVDTCLVVEDSLVALKQGRLEERRIPRASANLGKVTASARHTLMVLLRRAAAEADNFEIVVAATSSTQEVLT